MPLREVNNKSHDYSYTWPHLANRRLSLMAKIKKQSFMYPTPVGLIRPSFCQKSLGIGDLSNESHQSAWGDYETHPQSS